MLQTNPLEAEAPAGFGGSRTSIHASLKGALVPSGKKKLQPRAMATALGPGNLVAV